MTNSDGSCPTCHTRLEDDGSCSQAHEPVLGVLTGQVPVRSAPIAMKPEEDEPDDDESA